MSKSTPEKLAKRCDNFKQGAQKFYEGSPLQGDMWFFELYHHLADCADALRLLSETAALPAAHEEGGR